MQAGFNQYRSTMPIYAFACSACGHHYDRLQKLSDPEPVACPECGADAVKRQITAPSFRLSGSGWYETDFKKDSDRKRNLTEKVEGTSAGTAAVDAKTTDKPTEKKVESTPEAKPAAKAEPATKKPAADSP